MQTRGLRNNNPLNIRHSKDRWVGACTKQTDKSFVQFESMAYGYRAAWKTLESYWRYYHDLPKPFNVRNIITRWAPPAENDNEAYIRSVLEMTGLKANDHFSRPSTGIDYKRLELLVRAMTTMECGTPYQEVEVEALREGFDLAFPGVRKAKKRIEPSGPADIGVSKLPDIKGTTFADWDDYSDLVYIP